MKRARPKKSANKPLSRGVVVRPRDRMKHYQHPDVFGEWVGYELSKVDWKRFEVETRLEIRRDHLSAAARVHGGVIAAFFDASLGAAVFTTMEPTDLTSTVELKVNYLKPLELGDILTIRAKVVFRGKRLAVTQADLYRNRERKPVAIATATFYVVAADSKKREKVRVKGRRRNV